MKHVSFELAKTLREAGFDEVCEYAYLDVYGEEPKLVNMECDWNMERMNNTGLSQYMYEVQEDGDDVTAPTYMEVWLWLWKRGIEISVEKHVDSTHNGTCAAIFIDGRFVNMTGFKNKTTPEDLIRQAIDYLADNGLLQTKEK